MRKRYYTSQWRDGELADVNEQELAKDGETRNINLQEHKKEQAPPLTQHNALPISAVSTGALISAQSSAQGEAHAKTSQAEKDPPPPLRKQPQNNGIRAGWLAVLMALCLVAAVCIMLSATNVTDNTDYIAQSPLQGTENTQTDAALISKVMNPKDIHTAGIRSALTVSVERDGEVRRLSGTAVFEDGYVATLFDAVDGADSISVILDGGAIYSAKLIGGNKDTNIALLKTQIVGLCGIPASADAPRTGDRLYAVGALSTDGLDACFVTTEVAYEHRELCIIDDSGERRLRTVQLSPMGNSSLEGCPVFDEYGQAVGMVILTGDDADFAVTADTILPILQAIKNEEQPSSDILDGIVSHTPCLGVVCESYRQGEIMGARITSFEEGNHDAATILRMGDVIITLDNTPITDISSLERAISCLDPDIASEIFVYRDGQILSFFVRSYYK